MRRQVLLLVLSACAAAQTPLDLAYRALTAKDYDTAIRSFQAAISAAPDRSSIRKDLAYTLLKIGENSAARAQFAEASRLDPSDPQAALEYAFLCYETKMRAEARRVFDRLRKTGNPTAEEAFQNIDRPLADGIARWKLALMLSPGNFSAHQELARLAEDRDELPLAAEHYEKAWRLRPSERSLLLDLGRVWERAGLSEDATFALIAASRGTQPRVAEAARELLPARYPYVYEFEKALELDPNNADLRREFAYLLREMNRKPEAERQFSMLHHEAPDDAKTMADKSLKAGYLKDAVKYLTLAHEQDPVDFSVMLKLAWTYNVLRQDDQAVGWFNLARKAPDPKVAAEADRAWRNLHPNFAVFRTTAWFFPFYSTRWKDGFGYAQVKTEFKLGVLPLRAYISTRFVGDLRGTAGLRGSPQPQYLSEDSIILGIGVSTAAWHGLTGWMEAGESFRYLPKSASPDYRGGVAIARGAGHLLGSEGGFFAETNSDAVFISRFQKDVIVYAQNRTGYTLTPRLQFYWNWNASVDRLRQYWANAVETGPGVRFRVSGLLFSVDVLRGVYTVNEGNPRKPNYYDLRAGFWYAFTK